MIDAVVQAAHFNPATLVDKDRAQEELDKVLNHLEARHPEMVDQLSVKRYDDAQHSSKRLVVTSEVNGSPRDTVIDTEFLNSPEYTDLVALKEAFMAFGVPPYSIRIDEETHTATTYQEVLKYALDDAQRGLAIQRYKGLGEMNPEQLRETTMDPSCRTLLQVKVADAIEAERLISLLMGDEVEPRRIFIEQNAHTANLDV